jgi:shikimate kinase
MNMAEKNNVYIIGMMGVGKTTITNELKKLTKRTCVDIDELIVEKAGISILEIFSKFGENYFRKLETDVLEELSNKMNLLVSCGGGIIVNDINIDLMHKSGKVI